MKPQTVQDISQYLPILEDGYRYEVPMMPCALDWEWIDTVNNCRCVLEITWYSSPRNYEVSLKRFTSDTLFPEMGYFYDFGENHDFTYFDLTVTGLAELYIFVKKTYLPYFNNSQRVAFTWGYLWRFFYTEEVLKGTATGYLAHWFEEPAQGLEPWLTSEAALRPAPKLANILPGYVAVSKPKGEVPFEPCRPLVRG